VSPVCSQGHQTEAADYCDVCGDPVGHSPSTATAGAVPAEAPTGLRVVRCPNCGSETDSDAQCVRCGLLLGATDTATPWEEQLWEIVIRPSREFYEQQEQEGPDFPEEPYNRRIALVGDHIGIGRRSTTQKWRPEIDLSGTLEDTGVSRHHAVLLRRPQGSWALVDQGSTNGTYLKPDEDPIPAHQPFPLSDGDQVYLGYWTCLTAQRVDPPDPQQSDQVSRPSQDTRNVVRKRALEIDLLGPMRVRVQGQEHGITARHKRIVLSLLALRVNTPVTTEELEWAVWGDERPTNAGTQLRGYIQQLRDVVGHEKIETTQGYQLSTVKDCIDMYRFERRCERGRRLLASGHPGAAVAELDRALDLWRGEPLLDLVEGPTGPSVAVGLHERRASAEEDRFAAHLRLGEHGAVASDLSAAVEAAPFRERRWEQLILALYRSGQPLDASRAFARFRELLKESGLEPSNELYQLDGDIALRDPKLDWTAPDEGGSPPASVA
jgi:DNA-binding SARP family transcriptional activator